MRLSNLLRYSLLLGALLLGAVGAVHAGEAAPASDDPVLEAKLVDITSELRCLVCQNQTIADSHADLAVDLRNQVREMLRKGESREQIIQYMTARYGDFVLYRPPLKETTALLWFGPAALLLGGLAVLIIVLRRRLRMPAESFEPDEEAPGAAPAGPTS
jgi:cytochrome c-type biogenesis protein CcmH